METVHLVGQLREIHGHLLKFISSIPIEKSKEKHRVAKSFLFSILEGYAGCTELINLEIISQVPILSRSMIEALIDFEFLSNDTAAYKILRAEEIKLKRDYLDMLLKNGSYPERAEELTGVRDRYNKCLKYWEKRHVKPRLWVSKIENSNIDRHIKMACYAGSRAVHNNLLELHSRHRLQDDAGVVVCFKKLDKKSLKSAVVTINGTLLQATAEAMQFFEVAPDQDVLDAGKICSTILADLGRVSD
jgi:hypothetical protein